MLRITSTSTLATSTSSCIHSTINTLTIQHRYARVAKSPFGIYHVRIGQRKFPFHRRPHKKNLHATLLKAPYF